MSEVAEAGKPARSGRTIEGLIADLGRAGVTIWLQGDELRFRAEGAGAEGADFAELKARKPEALAHLRQNQAGRALPAFVATTRPDRIPLSLTQQFYADRRHPPVEHVSIVFRLEGALNRDRLRDAIGMIVERHEILRTRYVYEGDAIYQEVLDHQPPELTLVDLSHLSGQDQEEAVWARLHANRTDPIDLTTGKVLRAHLIALGPARFLLDIAVHHVAMDDLSWRVFSGELWPNYLGAMLGRKPSHPPLAMQYADYAVWENNWLSGANLDRSYAFWERRLAEVPPVRLPQISPRSPDGVSAMALDDIPFPEGFRDRVIAFAREAGLTMPMVFLAAINTVVAAWTGQKKVAIGYVMHGRPAGAEGIIGCFLRARPFYTDLTGDPTFLDLLKLAKQAYIEATDLRHPMSPEIREASRIRQIVLNLPTPAAGAADQPSGEERPNVILGMKISSYSPSRSLSTHVNQDLQILGRTLAYAGDWLDPRQVRWFAETIPDFLDRAMARPQARLSELLPA